MRSKMQSLQSAWKQLQLYKSDERALPVDAASRKENDMNPTVLKSVIKPIVTTNTPVIDMFSKYEEDSTNKFNESSSSSSLEGFPNFSNSSESFNNEIKRKFDKLPTNLLIPSTLALNQSFATSSSSNSHSNLTCRSEQDKWPCPESIEQVKSLCEKERLEGTPKSQLALCLHLMESAKKVDPDNQTALSPVIDHHQPFNLFSTILPHSHATPTSLGEAIVMEARHMLKMLANSSQSFGQGGEAEAQFLLASCYGMGALGWPINHYRAFQWYNQASKHCHPEATYRTAVCYELGIGTEKDGDRAIAYYRKAAHLLHVPSMYKLGVILMRGYCGNPISKREAVVWLQRAASTAMAPAIPGEDATTIGGSSGVALPHALHALAIIQLTKECDETSMVPDIAFAIKLLNNAARLGYAPSQSKLAECYECDNFCPEDEGQSIYWYTLAAKQDYPEACLALSGWYLTGSLKTNTLVQSDNEAYLWARKAASLAKRVHRFRSLAAKAYYTLGMYHESGIGVPKSVDNSLKWYKKAAHYGHPEAQCIVLPSQKAV
ncbi:unnamed protein product [Mucor hiemalis]